MAIDLARFYPVFFAESLEQLDAMEAELVRPNVETADSESINTIFRATHSIKGGSATFEFTDIAGLTHVLETLLDEVRAGVRALDQGLVDLLLESVDCLRNQLQAYQAGTPLPYANLLDLQTRVETLISAEATVTPSTQPAPSGAGNWLIEFTPHLHLLRNGNDPYRMLRELAGLGKLSAVSDLSRLPPLADLDPEACYLGWTIRLQTSSGRTDIDELFEWVEGDCDLKIDLEYLDLAAPELKFNQDQDPDPDQPATDHAEPLKAAMGLVGAGSTESIRVNTNKIDELIDLVGELVINESILKQLIGDGDAHDVDPLQDAMIQFSRKLHDLQESAMNMRMLPMAFCFSRLPRIVRDLGKELGKEVMLELHGENTEVDKTILEKITDPLIHMVRNAIDHGIEPVRQRLAAGKPSRATITVEVYHQGGMVIVIVADDGGGLDTRKILRKAIDNGLINADQSLSDPEIQDLIFSPGFSTAENVTDVSGRGVGLDIVRRNIQSLGGHTTVRSEFGKGTKITIVLPLTLAIIDGQLVRVADRIFVVPMLAIVENSQTRPEDFQSLGGEKNLYRFRDEVVPILDLKRVWGIESAQSKSNDSGQLIVVIEAGSHYIGLLVDELLGQQQTVIKSLETNFRVVQGVSGATILGDGQVALILDPAGLVEIIAAEEQRIGGAKQSVNQSINDEAHRQ